MKIRYFLIFAIAGMAIGLSSLRVSAATEQTRETQKEAQDKQAWIELVVSTGDGARNVLRKIVSGNSNSDLSEDKRAQGNALLEAFASKYLPNYFAQYKVARREALDKQAGYCDILDILQSENMDPKSSKAFRNFIGLYYDVSRKYFKLRREIIDLYVAHKTGLILSERLAEIDGEFATRSREQQSEE